jgi:hypothetical protein
LAALVAVMDHIAGPTLTDSGCKRLKDQISPQVIGH